MATSVPLGTYRPNVSNFNASLGQVGASNQVPLMNSLTGNTIGYNNLYPDLNRENVFAPSTQGQYPEN